MGQIELKDWSEIKQFKDPVYGYIPVCRAYIKSLIDTQPMQRIKGVAQTGLRPVFSSATHDRFSHSLGVYKFGQEMYRSLAQKTREYVKRICRERWNLASEKENELLEKLERCLEHWSTLLDIGCLLHDIGHPVQSHGFEFLYDDPYLDLRYDRQETVIVGDGMAEEEEARVYDILQKIVSQMQKELKGNLGKDLLQAFRETGDLQSQNFSGSIPGNPHERMSAYYIFQDQELRASVEELVRASRNRAGLESPSREVALDLCFIARMIIGWEYPVARQLEFNMEAFFYSIQNCVIHILNGPIDADGIDYLMRNSYAAGYDTSRVDSVRLCNAYTVYEENYVLFPAFSKSALSILEGYMSARNFEPKWLYSHHKVVYADLLTKQFYKYTTRYMTDCIMLLPSVKRFLSHASGSAIVCEGTWNYGSDLLLQRQRDAFHLDARAALRAHMENWSYPFYTYLLAPCRRYNVQSQYFYRSADADLDALFHWMCSELAQYKGESPRQKYESYIKSLKSGVLDRLPEEFWEKVSQQDLRILLAENCLLALEDDGGNASSILKDWIPFGCCRTALYRASRLPQCPSALIELLTTVEKTAGNSKTRKRALLRLWLERYEPLLSETDFTDLLQLSEEYQTRRFRSSLWKSRAEYQLFLKDCAKALGGSSNDVDRYMTALITEGMDKRGFSIFEGKAIKPTPFYEEQFYYLPPMQKGNRQQMTKLVGLFVNRSGETDRKSIVEKWAARIFTETEQYNFSRNNLTVKFCGIKSKRFNKIKLLFGDRVVPLEDIFPYHKSDGRFPYFYYNAGANPGVSGIPSLFQEEFLAFCREYRENEARSETSNLSSSHTFRDAVYGDVKMADPFYAVVCTREFQRLGRIRQLATADRSFPNATHTRLAHSLGTWYVMGMILDHFKELYQNNPQLNFTEEDRSCALLAALLHDLGHGPYSHTVETVFGLDHEKMTRRIILDPGTAAHQVIVNRFGPMMPERVCRLLDSSVSPEGTNGIDLIYHSVISGQLDADRIDYLLRDNTACGMAFGHIDIQQLITSMRLMPDYETGRETGSYRLCFDDRYLPAIEQFIYARYQMYKNVYHNSRKQLFEQIFDRLFRQAFLLLDAIRPDDTLAVLRRIRDGEDFSVSEYISLDDEAVNTLLKKWADGAVLRDGDWSQEQKNRAKVVQLLSQAFLYRIPLFEQIELGGQRRQYDLLAKRVGKQLGKNWITFPVAGGSEDQVDTCAFIYIQGSDCAYKTHDPETGSRKDIILRSIDNGTTRNYAQQSMFRGAQGTAQGSILETDYCCLFFSRELLKEECKMRGESDQTINAVNQTVESAKPRKHIEIEKKFYCTGEQLKQAEQYLDQKYPKAVKIQKAQTDTYFDCAADGQAWVLFDNQFSFRCREKGENYTFTVKIPTDSLNYHSSSQFARHEHEFVSNAPEITGEVWQFLIDTLDLCEKGGLCESLSRERMKPLLVVCNQRITYRLEELCEICLDTVEYKTADLKPMGSTNYQIEIELLAEPEAWAELEENVITPLIQKLGKDSLDCTSWSKLEKGMQIRKNQGAAT